nr:branched-chain amino acid ABC transporter permease [Stackebrandtia nassauensis]
MDGLVIGGIYALIALGYTLVYGVLKLINFAHSEVFMLGAFAAVGIWTVLGVNEGPTPSLGGFILLAIVGLAAAMAASGGTALALEYIAYRPLRRKKAPRLVFLITAIGVSLALNEGMGVLTSRDDVGVPEVFKQTILIDWDSGALGRLRVSDLDIGIIVMAFGLLVALDMFVNRTRPGAGIRAVAQDPDTAALMGINKNRIFALTFILGGLAAGVAAVMWDLRYSSIKHSLGFLLGVKAFTAAVMGGIGNLRGALVGGFALGLIENWSGAVFGNAWLDVVAFTVLVVVLMFRPTGLLGESLGRSKA